jgi:hypothetical protein
MANTIIQGAFGPVAFVPADTQAQPSAADMARLDDWLLQHRLTLPAAYRAFLMAGNGGKVMPNGFAYHYDDAGKALLAQVMDADDEIIAEPGNTLRYFHGFAPGPIADLISFQHGVQQWGRPGLFGIASASFGDLVVLDLAPGDLFGSVHYLTLQGIAPLVESGQQVPLGYIAPSFEVFQTVFFDFDDVMAQPQAGRLQDFLDGVLKRQ